MVCSTCATVRRAINTHILARVGLPQLPVQTSAPPNPVASPVQSPTNPAWPSRR
jgi:hypothetical protein